MNTRYLHTFSKSRSFSRICTNKMLPSTLPLTPSPTPHLLHKPHFSAVSFRPLSKSHICFAFTPSNQNPIGEEARWLREEQRWLREEQRWLREESRWNAERQDLLEEINSLKLRIQELERLNSLQGASVSETVANIAKLLQVLKEKDIGKSVNRIAYSGSSAVPLVVEAATKEEEVFVKQVISVPEKTKTVIRRTTLRKGSEGDEVQAMQEALQKLGFYCGEEDMEYSSFSSGTESAVKTWQATLGAQEDGIMTADLLEKLFGSPDSGLTNNEEHKSTDPEKGGNGAPVTSVTDINEIQQTFATKGSVTEVDVSEHRVFLLGENRWEDPSRLSRGSKNSTGKISTNENATTRCRSCGGQGRLLCMECDGTGEPNIEEQFMEWVDEGSKCPYCGGAGHITCDDCGGNA